MKWPRVKKCLFPQNQSGIEEMSRMLTWMKMNSDLTWATTRESLINLDHLININNKSLLSGHCLLSTISLIFVNNFK